MTTGDPAKAQPEAFEQSMFFQRFDGILRTAGSKPATGADHRGDHPLINFDQRYQRQTQNAKDCPSDLNFVLATGKDSFASLRLPLASLAQ
jgi:hypothetical protein